MGAQIHHEVKKAPKARDAEAVRGPTNRTMERSPIYTKQEETEPAAKKDFQGSGGSTQADGPSLGSSSGRGPREGTGPQGKKVLSSRGVTQREDAGGIDSGAAYGQGAQAKAFGNVTKKLGVPSAGSAQEE